ncbi:uncharacterized protein LOC132754850 [Ruditapes philippinarum]|uniref:uncharacterized protein LOC132754850 n=1 Tax=Ruditapes philippinarum TaxID=129788 RepID=UPI00295A591E|nr:uncharacterized protein LOC132754850 [Ruditapes philippinarum]
MSEKEEATNEKEVHAEVASEDVLLQDVSRDKVVVTQPKLNIVKPKKRKKRFHFTRVQAEIVAWISICCCCWPLGAYALLCACQAKVADDDEEYEKRLVWSTWLGIAGLIFNIVVWPGVILLALYT